jgi:hypothetical protein
MITLMIPLPGYTGIYINVEQIASVRYTGIGQPDWEVTLSSGERFKIPKEGGREFEQWLMSQPEVPPLFEGVAMTEEKADTKADT